MNYFVPSIEGFEHKVYKVWKKMEKYDKATLIKDYVNQIDPENLERFHHEVKAYSPQISANDHHAYSSISNYLVLSTFLLAIHTFQAEVLETPVNVSAIIIVLFFLLTILMAFTLYKSHSSPKLSKFYCFNFLEQELAARINSL